MNSPPPPRIAYLVNQYPKVSHSFIRREIRAVEALGFDVSRISIRGWDGELVDAEDLQERDRTRYVLKGGAATLIAASLRCALASPVKFLRAAALAIRLGRSADRPLPVHLAYLAEACVICGWLNEAGVRHLHAHFGTNSAEVAMLVRALGGPQFSFTVHGPEEFDKPGALHLAEKIRAASFVVAVSSFGSSQLRRWVGLDDWSKIRVVHCGLGDDFLRETRADAPVGKRLVCVGRLCEQKGQILLVMAAAELTRRGREFELVLAGDGEMRADVESLVRASGISDRVHVTGWLSNERVREEILRSRAMVLPSFAEGLPVVIMEAMALGRPVVSTYVAGIPELVRPGTNGWLVPAGDVIALADAMQAVLDAPDSILWEMGRHGRACVESRHSAVREAAKLASHFREAMERD